MGKNIKIFSVKEQVVFNGFIEYKNLDTRLSMCISVHDKIYEAENIAPFFVLKDIRKQMEKDQLIPMCKGARVDVHQSGMSSESFWANIFVIGFPATSSSRVNILDEELDTKKLSFVSEQEKSSKKWRKSLGF